MLKIQVVYINFVSTFFLQLEVGHSGLIKLGFAARIPYKIIFIFNL